MNAEEKIKNDIKKPKKKKTIEKNEIDYLRNQLAKMTKELSEVQNVTQNISIEAPYAHAKITVVRGGRSPKTEISLSLGGALDQMSFPDLRTHSESLLIILHEKLVEAWSKVSEESKHDREKDKCECSERK